MERFEVLLRKLQDQYQKKASAEQLLITVQMLHAEILQQKVDSRKDAFQGKISVILPGNLASPSASSKSSSFPGPEQKIVEILQVDEKEIERELEQIKKSAELRNELSRNNRKAETFEFDPIEDVPTLSSQEISGPPLDLKKELNMTLSDEEKPSLNDRLKEPSVELSEKLQEVPIRDLKKAIGINDRYQFINELFNGDEAMFERSVKTLNGFSIFPEAEFWMERELRMKMGWREDNPFVIQFYQLVRRRFS